MTERGHSAPGLDGAVVAQFESRHAGDLAQLVRRHGGTSWSAPALSEVPITGPEVSVALDRLVAHEFGLVVLLTGVGTRRLLDEADRRGTLDGAHRALDRADVVCRGPKPTFALKQHGLKPSHVVAAPHTTTQLLDTLATLPLSGRHALVVSAGERFAEPGASLRARGAHVTEVQVYRWDLSAPDAERLRETVRAIIEGHIDVALFTTQVQVRHLFDVADQMGEAHRLTIALRASALVGAVGPTCAGALRERGVDPDIIPEHPKMGHLVLATAQALAATTTAILHKRARSAQQSSPIPTPTLTTK